MITAKIHDVYEVGNDWRRSTFRDLPIVVTIEGVDHIIVKHVAMALKSDFLNSRCKVKGPVDDTSKQKQDFSICVNKATNETINFKHVRIHKRVLTISKSNYKMIDSLINKVLSNNVKIRIEVVEA